MKHLKYFTLIVLIVALVPTIVKADMICGTWAKNDTTTSSILSPGDITANRSDLVFKCIGGGGSYGASAQLIGIVSVLLVAAIIYKLVAYAWPEKEKKHEKR
jgi:hypothetical protein